MGAGEGSVSRSVSYTDGNIQSSVSSPDGSDTQTSTTTCVSVTDDDDVQHSSCKTFPVGSKTPTETTKCVSKTDDDGVQRSKCDTYDAGNPTSTQTSTKKCVSKTDDDGVQRSKCDTYDKGAEALSAKIAEKETELADTNDRLETAIANLDALTQDKINTERVLNQTNGVWRYLARNVREQTGYVIDPELKNRMDTLKRDNSDIIETREQIATLKERERMLEAELSGN